ncbi:hypothetical protein ACFU98_38685 [Streptomyces sp. NPDC057575]|uniref:hypothetical protein n=1 Tax=unclassified Streptomyces TaxID=2593676 RepID=UPI0036815001
MFHEKVSTRVKVWPEYEKAVAMARRFKRLHPEVQVILPSTNSAVSAAAPRAPPLPDL